MKTEIDMESVDLKDKTEVNEWEYYRNSKASSKSGELQIKFGFGIK